MGKIFVRRSTAILLGLLAVLTIVGVALIVAFLTPRCVPHEDPDTSAPTIEPPTGQKTHRGGHQPGPDPEAKPEPEPEPEGKPKPLGRTEPWEKNYRIPRETVPEHYRLYLHPDLDTGLFSGQVAITIDVKDTRDYLVVHTKFLNITKTKLSVGESGTDDVAIKETFEYEKNEFWVVRTEHQLSPNKYILTFDFNGNLTKSIVGLYRSIYTNQATKQKRYIATSKFQPTYARRAFPCFDEPSFKSSFDTTLVRPSGDGYIALSNMPVLRETKDEPRPGLTEVRFANSVPMVTYLACFIVCDFTYSNKTTAHGTDFRVYATPAQLERTRFAVDIGANITDFFEDYFRVSYPLPKQDMIAIPDFVSGAMEHWGLITYRETALLYDPRESSSFNKERVAAVISHELAHQWFGNLVTLEWWNDLWLNEGFASYIEYKGVAQYLPDWDIESHFVVSDLQRVLDYDAKLTSHPIVQTVDTPDQITEIFDIISYSKGASVLRMLENFMGDRDFRSGLSHFLRKFSYANAVTQDLWTELTRTSREGLDITKIMDTWTRQMGYPVLIVSRQGSNFILRQERFLIDPDVDTSNDSSPYNYKWEIPVTYITSENNQPHQVWMHRNQTSMELQIAHPGSWVKFNKGHYGYYRVQYDQEGWDSLSAALLNSHESLDPGDRASLLIDAFSLAEAGHIPYSTPLNISRYLKKERHYVPWEGARKKLLSLSSLLTNTPVYSNLRKYLVDLVWEHFVNLGWEDEGSHLTRTNRINILNLACGNGHQGCLKEAGQKLMAWLNDTSSYIPPNIRTLVYQYGMEKLGGVNEWDIMWERYLKEDNAQERLKLTKGLSSVREPWILQRFLNYAKNESYVRSQDYFTVLRYITDNPVGTPIVWNFVRQEWEYLVGRFSLNNRYLGRVVPSITSHFSTGFQLQQIEDFFAKYPEAGAGSRSRKSALENVRNNIRWLNKHQYDVGDWLKEAV